MSNQTVPTRKAVHLTYYIEEIAGRQATDDAFGRMQ